MKTLGRVNIQTMENELQVLQEREKKMVLGGIAINGYCYFYCLEYLSNTYNCGNNISYYTNGYGNTYGFSGVVNGPTESGFLAYTNNEFSATQRLSESTMRSFISNSAYSVMAVIDQDGIGHAIILKSYSSGQYTYYDPTTDGSGVVPSTKVLFGIGVNGCK
jgi:hypothetical protein